MTCKSNPRGRSYEHAQSVLGIVDSRSGCRGGGANLVRIAHPGSPRKNCGPPAPPAWRGRFPATGHGSATLETPQETSGIATLQLLRVCETVADQRGPIESTLHRRSIQPRWSQGNGNPDP